MFNIQLKPKNPVVHSNSQHINFDNNNQVKFYGRNLIDTSTDLNWNEF